MVPETDAERRETLLNSSSGEDKEKLRSTTLLDFWGEFSFGSNGVGSSRAAEDVAMEVRAGTSVQGKPKGKAGVVAEEIVYRKRENLGLTGSGKKLGSAPKVRDKIKAEKEKAKATEQRSNDDGWDCAVCTL